MRRRGFALSETLVALAIGALVVGALLYLQVDYVQLTRRLFETAGGGGPGGRIEHAFGFRADPCREPGAALRLQDRTLLLDKHGAATRLAELQPAPGGATLQLEGAGAVAGLKGQVGLRAASALRADGTAWPGRSMSVVDVEGEPIAVAALRCDLPEVCDLDALATGCRRS